jgi:hypothetical protein
METAGLRTYHQPPKTNHQSPFFLLEGRETRDTRTKTKDMEVAIQNINDQRTEGSLLFPLLPVVCSEMVTNPTTNYEPRTFQPPITNN